MNGRYDRDYERMERRRRTRRKSTTATVIAVVVIVAALIALAVVIVSVVNANKPAGGSGTAAEPATSQPTLYIATQEVPTTVLPGGTASPTEGNIQQPTEYYTPPTEAQQYYTPTEAPDDEISEGAAEGSATGDNGVLHVYTSGHVTGDYYWTYDIDNVNVTIKCSYDYSSGQYDFNITGVSPGTANITLYYKTDDTNKASTNVTVSVADDLTVTQIG